MRGSMSLCSKLIIALTLIASTTLLLAACIYSDTTSELNNIPTTLPNTEKADIVTKEPTISQTPLIESKPSQTADDLDFSQTFDSLIAVGFSFGDNFLLTQCEDLSKFGKILIISPRNQDVVQNIDEQNIGFYYPVWHPSESSLAYLQVDYSDEKEIFQNSEIIRTFEGDQIRIVDILTNISETVGKTIERSETLTASRTACNTRQGMSRLLGWSPDGKYLHYRFYVSDMLGEQFALLNIETENTSILAQNLANFDWIEEGEQVVALNHRERVFELYDTDTGNHTATLPLPPTSSDDWLPLIEWSDVVGTFVSDAPSSLTEGTSFWIWNANREEWIEESNIPSDYPVRTWDTHSQTTYVCSAGNNGAQLILLTTEDFTLLNVYNLPPDVLCRTMRRSVSKTGLETVYFLLDSNSLYWVSFQDNSVTNNQLNLARYTEEINNPYSNESVKLEPIWIDVYP
jgi:hypothetical protein